MSTKRPLLALAFSIAAFSIASAEAAPLVHDTKAEFKTYSSGNLIRSDRNDVGGPVNSFRGTQGLMQNGAAVANDRSDIDNMFTAEGGGVFYSMGLGRRDLDPRVAAQKALINQMTRGTLSLTINPGSNRRITGGSLAEITNQGNDNHAEALWVFLGTESDPFKDLIGLIWNEDADPTSPFDAGAWNANTAIATLSAANTPNGEGGRFSFTVNSGNYNTISFFDASRAQYVLPITGFTTQIMNNWSTSTDGFDVDALKINSNDVSQVSEPATLALLGAGLFGLGLVRRRKA